MRKHVRRRDDSGKLFFITSFKINQINHCYYAVRLIKPPCKNKTLSNVSSYTSSFCYQGQMRSITTVTISMTTSPAAIIGLVVKETELHIMGYRPK